MAMSSLSTASHSLFNARVPPLRRQSSLRLVDRHVGFSGSGVAPADHRGFLPGGTKLAALAPAVAIAPANGVKRRAVSWPGMAAEVVQATSSERIAFRAHALVHTLVLCERGARRDGETSIEGVPSSTLRDVTRKFTFVPAGHGYCDWHEPRTAARR